MFSQWVDEGRNLIREASNSPLGSSPYQVAQRYSRGEISRKQVIDALARWHYLPAERKTQGIHDDLLNYTPGSFDDVEAASMDELIDEEIYAAALVGLRSRAPQPGDAH
jgi:hypothetical protein